MTDYCTAEEAKKLLPWVELVMKETGEDFSEETVIKAAKRRVEVGEELFAIIMKKDEAADALRKNLSDFVWHSIRNEEGLS